MAGRVNLVSGTMEGAELREFVRYEKVWLPHTDVDVVEISLSGGSVHIQLIADSDVSWSVTAPEWITPSVTSGTGSANIVLQVARSQTAREGWVRIGTANVKVVQKGMGDFGADFNEDFRI